MDSLVLTDVNGKQFYNRSMHPSFMELCKHLNYQYGKNSVITPSGMAAIHASLMGCFFHSKQPITHIIYGNEMYCDTPRLLKFLKPSFHFELVPVSISNNEEIVSVFDDLKGKSVIFLMETCSNPGGDVFDFDLISELRKKVRNMFFIADNTWLASLFNPFKYDVDLVVTSLTKYYSAGTAIAGAVIGNGKLYNITSDYLRITGNHVSPLQCQEILKHIGSLRDRIMTAGKRTEVLAPQLEKIVPVKYPGLMSHQCSERARKYYGGPPAILIFRINKTKADTISWMKSFKHIKFATSYGACETRLDPWPFHDGTGTWCRLSVGYGHNYEKEVSELFDKLNSL